MKKSFVIALQFFIVASSFLISVAVKADIYDEVSAAIRSGNSKDIARFFNANVDLAILTQEDVYSKVQAELILKDFFVKNSPKTFTIIHRGTSKEGAMYSIGTLTTAQGLSFRVYFFIKQTNEKYYLQELRFEKE